MATAESIHDVTLPLGQIFKVDQADHPLASSRDRVIQVPKATFRWSPFHVPTMWLALTFGESKWAMGQITRRSFFDVQKYTSIDNENAEM